MLVTNVGKESPYFVLFNTFGSRLQQHDNIVLDLETNGLTPYNGSMLVGVAIYLPEWDESYYLSYAHPETSNLNWNDDLTFWNNLFQGVYGHKTFYTWNGKFDLNFLYAMGVTSVLTGDYTYRDGMLALHLVDENRYLKGGNYKLKDNAKIFLNAEAADEQAELREELKARGLKKGDIGSLPAHLVSDYAEQDVKLTWQMEQFLNPYLDKWLLREVYEQDCEYTRVGALRMEATGFKVDLNLVDQAIENADREAAQLHRSIENYAGHPLNPNSPQQLKSILGLPNTAKETLENSGHLLAETILDYRVYSKAGSTFFRPYKRLADPQGYLHPSLHVMGTITGRLSCSDPNLQQVPRDGDKYGVKAVFIAPEGYKLVQADYKAMELRLATHYAKCQPLIDAFNSGADPHLLTASRITGQNIELIDKETRNVFGKTPNFFFLYGAGVEKSAKKLNRDCKTAKEILTAWHGNYPEFRRMHMRVKQVAETGRNPDGSQPGEYNYIRYFNGRVRHCLEGNSFHMWNSLIQGTGAEIMKIATINVAKRWPDPFGDVQLVMTVHDSLILYVKEDKLDEVLPELRDIMTDFPQFNPRMGVDIEVGDTWGKLKSYAS